MKIRDILKIKGSKVWTVQANQPVQEALRILVAQKIGALLVSDERGKVVGILSERDIVRGCHDRKARFEDTRVRDLMTAEVIVASPDDEINDIMSVMTEKRVRHIPVVAEGKLQGMVSIGDVVKLLLDESRQQIESLKEFMYGPAKDS